jgi:hypothetical protein
MADETEIGSAGASDGGGYPQSGGEFGSPLQARAAFLKNWNWQSVTSINRGACARGKALHGINSETGAACAAEWEVVHVQALTFGETLDLLRSFHRKAPFLFLNGNTFATMGRELTIALSGELSAGRRREMMSAVGHYVAGVLDREPMVQIIESLCESALFQPGDRVKTLRGSLHGQIVRLEPDGRIVWQPDETTAELIAMPESLVREA